MRVLRILLVVSAAMVYGCPLPPHPPTPVGPHLQVDPVTKGKYWIYIPSTYRHDRPAPVIVSCHGSPPFDVSEHHVREWKWLAEQHGCIVIAPSLVGTDGILGGGPVSAMLANERTILSVISTLGYRYNIDRANVMITGFSGGGFPTYWVGLRHPDVFTVIVARNCNFNKGNLSGWVPRNTVKRPVMVYWGENDPAPIVGQSQDAVRFLRARGYVVGTAIVRNAGHERHPEVAMTFFLRKKRPADPSLPSAPVVKDARPLIIRKLGSRTP